MSKLKKFLKFLGFILLVVIGLALIVFVICSAVTVSPILLIGYGLQQYFSFRTERMKVKARLEYKLNKGFN